MGSNWVQLGSAGFKWVHLGSTGWVHMGSTDLRHFSSSQTGRRLGLLSFQKFLRMKGSSSDAGPGAAQCGESLPQAKPGFVTNLARAWNGTFEPPMCKLTNAWNYQTVSLKPPSLILQSWSLKITSEIHTLSYESLMHMSTCWPNWNHPQSLVLAEGPQASGLISQDSARKIL